MDRELLLSRMGELPIVQYEFFRTEELIFSQRVRYICEAECPQYGKSWACPPAVGTVESCREKCLSYAQGLLITTMAEVNDIADIQETLDTRGAHEDVTRQAAAMMRQQGVEPYVLSTESCAVCEKCAYPAGGCRHPERMYPCVESHGILVTDLAERYGIDFQVGGNVVTWFSLLLYN